jgi:hypothetical protein
MRKTRGAVVVAASAAMAWVGTAVLAAGDDKPAAPATATADSFFASLRKSATAKDEAALAAALPSKLVAGWPDDAKEDGKAWRADFAARLAAGDVTWVHETGGSAVARWKTSAATWDLPLQKTGEQWKVASPWAYCVAGGDLAKANGRGPAHVKLKARTAPDSYAASAFSFTHATSDMSQCKNRADVWYCGGCKKLHLKGTQASVRTATSVKDLDGLQTGGDWSDRIAPKANAVYALACNEPGRKDFQVALQVTACSDAGIEFDWCLVAAGKDAPADIHSPQPLTSNDGADGCDGMCASRGK